MSRLAGRGLRFYYRTHLGLLFGVAMAVTVLVGALGVGDSMRGSLERMTRLRLGRAACAVTTGERFFRRRLGDELSIRLKTDVATLLRLPGTASTLDSRRRAPRVQILGVDSKFWSLSPSGESPVALDERGAAAINTTMAERLGLGVGDELVVRVRKPGLLPGDLSYTTQLDETVGIRLAIRRIVNQNQLGRFDLAINQVPPCTVYVEHDTLADRLDLTGRANLLLVADIESEHLDEGLLERELRHCWTLEDAGLTIGKLPGSDVVELTTTRVFLAPAVEEAVREISPASYGVLTYFVNSLTVSGAATPYSFVSAVGPTGPGELPGEGEIVLNEWCARDLGVGPGGDVGLTYYYPEGSGRLKEVSESFRVVKVISIDEGTDLRTLTPPIPGLTDSGNCRDWDPGLPIDTQRIREKDEEYWRRYGPTPKGFVSLSAAQRMWKNRFGRLTSMRFPPGHSSAELAERLIEKLPPESMGVQLLPLLDSGLRAGREAVDFGELFLGLSGFVMMAALILAGLLFGLSLERRLPEAGVLKGLGYSRGRLLFLFLAEGGLVAALGSILGGFGGLAFDQLVLWALGTIWLDAVGVGDLVVSWNMNTWLTGVAAGFFSASLILSVVAFRRMGRIPLALIKKREPSGFGQGSSRGGKLNAIAGVLGFIGIASALTVVALVDPARGMEAARLFWTLGLAALIGFGLLAWSFMGAWRLKQEPFPVSTRSLCLKNLAGRPGRSLAVMMVLACSLFIIVAVGVNRQDPGGSGNSRGSGTGGFALYGEAALSIGRDLNDPAERRSLGLDRLGPEVQFVQMRARRGDDASCLNLHRVTRPGILGVNPEELNRRGAFSFQAVLGESDNSGSWMLLNRKLPENVVPAVADETVIVWGLGKKVGDEMTVRNKRGEAVTLRLVAGLRNSIFQGRILVSESAFLEYFPEETGTRVLLVDIPEKDSNEVRQKLDRALSRYGVEWTSTRERLNAFNAVSNTYLTIFLQLGALGILLGTVGLGVVVVRNTWDRRGEIAIMRAVGFSLEEVRRVIRAEHYLMILAGFGGGFLAAMVAAWPSLLSSGNTVPVWSLLVIMVVLVGSAMAWIFLATRLATRGNLLDALRSE